LLIVLQLYVLYWLGLLSWDTAPNRHDSGCCTCFGYDCLGFYVEVGDDLSDFGNFVSGGVCLPLHQIYAAKL
jgi:hypothetical protein